jgi:hypothetical protein
MAAMISMPTPTDRNTGRAALAALLLFVPLLAPLSVFAQSTPTSLSTATPTFANEPTSLIDTPGVKFDPAVQPAGCSSCGSMNGGHDSENAYSPAGCGTPCCGNCYAGRRKCCPCEAETVVGRFLCGIYECICCNDPCYEPTWIPVANSAFFVDSARPVSQSVVRWDRGVLMSFPDRAAYFMPRADGMGTGPAPAKPFFAETNLNYDELILHSEAATGLFAFFTEFSYRSIQTQELPSASGFGDMAIGTKSVLFDCELLTVTFQFKSFFPIGNFNKGLGAGHVSLEPSALFALRCSPDTYIQGQISEWIPIGGLDPGYAGSILHTHLSVNHILCKPIIDVQFIGALEFSAWAFQTGAYSDAVNGPYQKAGGDTYLSLGPSFRLVVCNKLDFGLGVAFSLTNANWYDTLYRTEARFRF